MDHELKVVKLHDFPDLIEKASLLLNSEWPRSLSARCHSLKKSSDDLPCILLLLQVPDGNVVPEVVGCSSLSKALGEPKSVVIESVIVDIAHRGCGLGRMMMERTEDLARKLGYEISYLSTEDKCMFYEHLGYRNSIAVSPERDVTKFLSKALIEKQTNKKKVERKETTHLQQNKTKFLSPHSFVLPPHSFVLPPHSFVIRPVPPGWSPAPSPPPAPPPPPPLLQVPSFYSTSHQSALFSASTERNKNILEHKKIFWMKKNL